MADQNPTHGDGEHRTDDQRDAAPNGDEPTANGDEAAGDPTVDATVEEFGANDARSAEVTAAAGGEAAGGRTRAEAVDAEALLSRIDLLQAENERLREAHERLRREQYRRATILFGLVGVVALAGAVAFPNVRELLLGLAGIGAFAAILLLTLVPEQFVPASVGRAIYGTIADTEAALAAELGLKGDPRYVPTDRGSPGVRLYVPQATEGAIPPLSALSSTFIVGEGYRGIALQPTGTELVDEFVKGSGDLPDEPAPALEALGEAIREQFELAETVTPEYDDGLATVRVDGSRLGDPTRPDHPVQSVIGVGLAAATGETVRLVDADRPAEEETRALITYRVGDVATETDATDGEEEADAVGEADAEHGSDAADGERTADDE